MTYRIPGFGWLPDPLDHRDRHVRDSLVRKRLDRVIPRLSPRRAKATADGPAGPLQVDLREWCSPIENQGSIGSCTAHAVVGALEYFERRARGIHADASRLFLYKVTRRYLGWDHRGDTGAFVRSAIKALRIFGTLPESYWPYLQDRFDVEPEAFHYAFAQSFRALEYFRLEEEPSHLKSVLDVGLPFAFGFTCFSSIGGPEVMRTGVIPYPISDDQMVGGHAVLAVGYSDTHVLIRNSWGEGWGQRGYGYLPWSYFDAGSPLATDCWALLNATWLEPDPDVDDMGAIATRARRSRSRRARAAAPIVNDQEPDFVVKVRDGNDPVRQVPLHLSSTGVVPATPDTVLPLVASDKRAALYLKSVLLKESFDWALFGKAVNEVYLAAICWDLSGRAPWVFPVENAASPKAVYRAAAGDRMSFVGDGLELWPSGIVVGSLNVRIVVLDNDDETRTIGQRLTELKALVANSQLTAVLASLAVAPAAATIVAVSNAVTELLGIVGALLAKDGDDLVGLFDGCYGAERLGAPRLERYDQRGCAIELELAVTA